MSRKSEMQLQSKPDQDITSVLTPEPMEMTTLLQSCHADLLALAGQRSLSVYRDSSKYNLILDLARDQVKRGGKITAEGVIEFAPDAPMAFGQFPTDSLRPDTPGSPASSVRTPSWTQGRRNGRSSVGAPALLHFADSGRGNTSRRVEEPA